MNAECIRAIIVKAVSAGQKALTEPSAKELLKFAGVSVPRFEVISEIENAEKASARIGFPLVLKVISRDISHKSEAHGVSAGIKNFKALEDEISCMTLNVADHSPFAEIEGFLLEEFIASGVEVVAGALRDSQFGPVVMFGSGGAGVELMKDVSWRLGPVTKDEALEMMSEVKGYPLLTGFRGSAPKDINAVAEVLVTLSKIMDENPELKELEINPLMAGVSGAVAVDAKASFF